METKQWWGKDISYLEIILVKEQRTLVMYFCMKLIFVIMMESSFSRFSQIRKGWARGQNYGNDCFSFSYLYFRWMLLKHKKCKFALTYYKQQEIYDSRVQILVFFKRCTFLKKNFLLSLVFSHSAGVGALVLVISIGRETMQWAWLTCHPPTLQC